LNQAGPDADPTGQPSRRQTSGEISAAQIIDMDRAQIGHDLHDLLLPLIFAASANLQPLLNDSASQPASTEIDPAVISRVRKSHDWLQEALSVGRNLLTHLYPVELDQLPWLVAAKDVAGRLCGEGCEVIWSIDENSPVCDSGWDRDVAATAYRVLVESLRNAIHHGKSETIAVRCQPDCLLIVDDGDGFDPSAVDTNRFGIRSMKGRAALVGKSLTVDSVPGGPTTVRLDLSGP
jgi:signal transduction histidine kinase